MANIIKRKSNITKEQFNEFKEVRESGTYNMFDPRARETTTLTKDEWIEIMSNYTSLKESIENNVHKN
jgi:hypothetical protein